MGSLRICSRGMVNKLYDSCIYIYIYLQMRTSNMHRNIQIGFLKYISGTIHNIFVLKLEIRNWGWMSWLDHQESGTFPLKGCLTSEGMHGWVGCPIFSSSWFPRQTDSVDLSHSLWATLVMYVMWNATVDHQPSPPKKDVFVLTWFGAWIPQRKTKEFHI